MADRRYPPEVGKTLDGDSSNAAAARINRLSPMEPMPELQSFTVRWRALCKGFGCGTPIIFIPDPWSSSCQINPSGSVLISGVMAQDRRYIHCFISICQAQFLFLNNPKEEMSISGLVGSCESYERRMCTGTASWDDLHISLALLSCAMHVLFACWLSY